jgi:hypothetical protein
MSEIIEYLDAQLVKAYKQKVIDYGYWCPRCHIEAWPQGVDPDDVVLGETPGWCSFCGLDPQADGPAQPFHFAGLR